MFLVNGFVFHKVKGLEVVLSLVFIFEVVDWLLIGLLDG